MPLLRLLPGEHRRATDGGDLDARMDSGSHVSGQPRAPRAPRRAARVAAVGALVLVPSSVPASGEALRPDGHPMRTVQHGSACVDSAGIRWQPASPRSGTLVMLSIAGPKGQPASVTKRSIASIVVSGEPVYLVVSGDSAQALAPIPIDSTSGVTLRVRCTRGDTVTVRIQATPGNYQLEQLRVAPRFSAPPSAALAARIRREGERAAAISTMSHATPPLWRLPFVAPRASRITSPYGGGRVFNGAITSRHMGTDYAGAIGNPVRATNRGVVRLVDRFYLGGNVVYVDHGGALISAYLHLSRAAVRVGDTMSAGSLIGYVGATGRVTGPHLHFVLRYGAMSLDPTSALALR